MEPETARHRGRRRFAPRAVNQELQAAQALSGRQRGKWKNVFDPFSHSRRRLRSRSRGRSAVFAQAKPVIKASSLTLPVFNPIVWNIMKERGFDAKHGFELDPRPYPSISAFYAAFATGETDALIGGPTILQKLSLEGVPVRIVATGFTLADLVIFARDQRSSRSPTSRASRSRWTWEVRSSRSSRSGRTRRA